MNKTCNDCVHIKVCCYCDGVLPICDSFLEVKPKVETNIYDTEEIYPNCTVQILTNTLTGETSTGWWKND